MTKTLDERMAVQETHMGNVLTGMSRIETKLDAHITMTRNGGPEHTEEAHNKDAVVLVIPSHYISWGVKGIISAIGGGGLVVVGVVAKLMGVIG